MIGPDNPDGGSPTWASEQRRFAAAWYRNGSWPGVGRRWQCGNGQRAPQGIRKRTDIMSSLRTAERTVES